MKIYKLVVLTVLFVTLAGFSTSENKNGIEFIKIDFEKALSESAVSGKPIFIDFYATWCGPCKHLKNTSFRDKAVGEYYNKNFVCLSINGEKGEGPELLKMYGISSYPTLLIVDSKARVMAKTEGFMKPYILINFGRRVIP